MRSTICLLIMARNEGHIIRRALESAKPWVTRWVVVDTGSEDDTIAQAEEAMCDAVGHTSHNHWVSFGINRTSALTPARMLGTEYILVLDADQTLEVDDPHAFDDLRADGYDLAVRYGALTYTLPRLLAANKPWQWLGATHEYLQCSDSVVVQSLPGVRIVEHADSHRRNTGAKIPDDIALLTRDLEVDPLNTRALFYLANTWADAGWPEKALEYYRRRVALGGWSEERWYAQYRIGRCWQALNSWDDAVTAYLAAIQMDPQRAEPYYWMAVGMVKRFRVLPALLYLETACKIPNPTGKLFVETSVYEHELRMLLALVRAQGKP